MGLRLQHERDLYRAVLDLGLHEDVEPFLEDALRLVVATTRATEGYLELSDEEGTNGPRWWAAHALDDPAIADVRRVISRGVIAEAIATGETILTPSALLDPRFGNRDSVRAGQIDAVLCAPIGADPPRGVVYLQGCGEQDGFTDEDRTLVETFGRHVAPVVDRLLARRRQRETTDPTRPMRERLRLEGVIGRSAALAEVLKQVALVAPLDVTVLLTGDSGTGKSQLARVIHDNGPRTTQPFVEINCAALPENLIESELFGAMPGSHSTATRRIEGKVEAASRGTLFLDEVGELPLPAQAKLLQLVQSKRYYPLGGTKPITADVRVIAASNADLTRAVAERRFRDDLFYRLQVLPLRVPSLAERREDIPDLAGYFVRDASRRHGLAVLAFSPAAMRALGAAVWPGNIRQLANAIEAAVIRAAASGADAIEAAHLFTPPAQDAAEESTTGSFQERTRRFQAQMITETLEECDWSVTEAARRLDLTRAHVYNLIRAFRIVRRSDR